MEITKHQIEYFTLLTRVSALSEENSKLVFSLKAGDCLGFLEFHELLNGSTSRIGFYESIPMCAQNFDYLMSCLKSANVQDKYLKERIEHSISVVRRCLGTDDSICLATFLPVLCSIEKLFRD